MNATATTTVFHGFEITPTSFGSVSFHREGDELTFWANDEAEARTEILLLLDPAKVEAAMVIEARLVTEDYCFMCGRVTDHRGEHSLQQLLTWE